MAKAKTRQSSPYDERFYAEKNQGSHQSASIILPLVLAVIRPRSVVDVGCGTGTWLRAVSELGVQEYQGYDGAHVKQLQIPKQRFAVADLSRPLHAARRFDLAICCEVAEHLPTGSAETLVASLAALSDAVLFSAAIPGQGGKHHVNEQWPAYWQALFRARVYSAYDFIRPQIWNDRRVEFWYRQNTILYVADSAASSLQLPDKTSEVLALVHPELYERQRARQHVRNAIRNTRQALSRLSGRNSGV